MKTSSASLLVLCAAGIASAGLFGTPAEFPSFAAASKVGVVSFSLEKSIVVAGGERDEGPGILQKPEEYYRLHQSIVDSMWNVFRDTMPAIFAGPNILPLDSLIKDPAYAEAVRCQPKKLMGRIVLPCPDLEPKNGLVAASDVGSKTMMAWGAKNGFNYYVTVANRAEYFLSAGAGVNGLVAGAGKMRVVTTVLVVDPSKGIVWSRSYKNESFSSAAMVNSLFPESGWIFAVEAFRRNLAELAKDVAKVGKP